MNSLTEAQRAAFGEALDLLADKLLVDESVIGIGFPYVTAPDGSWRTMLASVSAGYAGESWSHGNWFCGFWVGLHLAAHLHRGEERFLEIARERMRLVEQRAEDPNTHDIGFIFNASAVPAYHVTGEDRFAEIALAAAARLRSRLVRTRRGAYVSSWGPLHDPRGRKSSAIDTMANLALLYWAAEQTGDESFLVAGEQHALTTRDAFVRDDFSTYHAVEYELGTGERIRGYTFQGYGDESCWARGQGWAVLGYVDTAQATGELAYLRLADNLADHFIRRLDGDPVAPNDFDEPPGPGRARDTAASAVVANALLRMSEIEPDAARAQERRAQAIWLLEGLCGEPLAREASHRGLLKHGCYSKPHDIGPDAAVLFGDFYFVDALCRVVMPGRFRPQWKRLDSA